MSIKFGPIFHVGYAVPDMDKALAFCDGFAMGGTALEFIEASDEIRAKFGKLKTFCNAWDGSDPIRGKIGAAQCPA